MGDHYNEDNRLRVRVSKDEFGEWVQLRFYKRGQDKLEIVSDVVWELIDDTIYPGPTPFQLTGVDAQSLMDQLWDTGIRPTEGKGSAGSLAATEHERETLLLITERLLKLIENSASVKD